MSTGRGREGLRRQGDGIYKNNIPVDVIYGWPLRKPYVTTMYCDHHQQCNQQFCRTTPVTANQTSSSILAIALTVHHLLTHASQAYVNDERTGGGLKVLERAGLSAWLLFLCNVSV